MVTEQIPMQFSWQDGFSFENYFAGVCHNDNALESNVEAAHHLQQIASSESVDEQFLFLWGFAHVGKSHLLQAACQQAANSGLTVAYLPLKEIGELDPEMFTGLEQLSLVCIDDVQLLVGNDQCEQALFHLYNRMRDAGNKMIVAADVAPNALLITLADLQSRLSWGPVLHLQELNDENKIMALQLRAKLRGFELTEEVGLFLIRRSARDMVSLFSLLDKLDEASLAQHRKLTIPFVRGLI
ncbi:MAG: DnaA regulatory inactivator Hda [Gammaproteobacteria bacterium]